MKSLLAGIASGVALGVLFAPTRGEQTRRRIRAKATEIGDRAMAEAERLKGAAGDYAQQGGSYAQRVAEQASDTTSHLKDAAQRIATKAGLGPLAMLNTASREELMTVRGIGPVLADRIIKGRPFTSAEQVMERGILPANILEELKRESKSA